MRYPLSNWHPNYDLNPTPTRNAKEWIGKRHRMGHTPQKIIQYHLIEGSYGGVKIRTIGQKTKENWQKRRPQKPERNEKYKVN